ncbi:hypothetical protein HPB47_000160 [Ixodes persulcatus]|uniref:Uncharacterized protein n=1 Tax=Ixodes persulcatus TaxID=34615 RepID=A0AC60PU51_IXOPE|nr:hypothetical protein HPB47_000160 [Ixodes persulcatus]
MPSTPPAGWAAGTRAADKQFYKDILAQQQENAAVPPCQTEPSEEEQLLCYAGKSLCEWRRDRLSLRQQLLLLKGDQYHRATDDRDPLVHEQFEAQHTARRFGRRHTGCRQAVL